jgi:hypothetical protein
VRGACHFVACARPPGEAVSGAGEVCGCEGGGSRGQGLLSTGRFYLAPALWPLRPRVPRIYVFRVMLVSLPGAEARAARGSPGRVTTLRPRRLRLRSRSAWPARARGGAGLRPYGYAGSERASARAGHRRCCAPPPRVTRPRRDPFSVLQRRPRVSLPDSRLRR